MELVSKDIIVEVIKMEITTNTTKTTHESYDEYDLSQLIVVMDIGEKLTISIDDVVIKEYTAKYINCHFNLGFQDKGEKINLEQLSEAELIQRQIDTLEAKKIKAEAQEPTK